MKTQIYLLKAAYLVSSLILAGIVSFLMTGFGPPPPPPGPADVETVSCYLSLDFEEFADYVSSDVASALSCLSPLNLVGQDVSFMGTDIDHNTNHTNKYHVYVKVRQPYDPSTGVSYDWSYQYTSGDYVPGYNALIPIVVPASGQFTVDIEVVEPDCCKISKKKFVRALWYKHDLISLAQGQSHIQIDMDGKITAWQRKKC